MPRPDPAVPAPARSLADDIRARTDDELAALLRRRPDLARPTPADLTALASRAATRASVHRAIDQLDRGRLQVLETLVHLDAPADAAAVVALVADGPAVHVVQEVLDDLWRGALLWRAPEGLVPVRAVAEVLEEDTARGLAGLGPAWGQVSTAPRPSDEEVRAVLGQAPDAARRLLDALLWGPAQGSLAAGSLTGEPGSSAVGDAARWLVSHRVLVPAGPDEVVLPREVALVARAGRLHPSLQVDPPPATGSHREPQVVDRAAGGQVTELITLVDELASGWGVQSPRVLRAGGLSVRDLRLLAVTLDTDTTRAAFVAEVAYGAGLIDDDGGLDPVWAPTPDYDTWSEQPGAAQWSRLARSWLSSTRAPHLVGATPVGAPSAVNALGPLAAWPAIRALRQDVLAELADLPEGMAPDLASILARLRWRRPRRLPMEVEQVVSALLTEAESLGVTGRGALGSAGRALLAGADEHALAEHMHPHLPAPVEHVLLQADLTAVAPGPVVGRLAQLLRLVADVESRGGATVHRFSEASVRRALDAGWSADQLLEGLRDASQTPVPQPLEYLVRDTARRHGQTRVGSVAAYVRSDDPATLEALEAHRGLAALQLHRLAPTVLVSPAAAPIVLEMLRDNGFAPMIETPGGGVVVPPTVARRAGSRRRAVEGLTRRVEDELASGLVQSLRSAEEAAQQRRAREADAPGPALPSTDPTTALAVLREGIAERHGVWIGYADRLGGTSRMLFHPQRVEGGRVHGTVDGVHRTLSVHRITGAATA